MEFVRGHYESGIESGTDFRPFGVDHPVPSGVAVAVYVDDCLPEKPFIAEAAT